MENLGKINKQNVTIFYALFAGQALFLLVSAYLLKTSGPKSPEMISSFQILLPTMTLSGVFGSFFIYKFLLKGVLRAASDKEKLEKYRSAFLCKMAFIEGANLFTIVVYMLTGSNLALILSFCLLVLFILNKPSEDKLREELEIK
jgi:hypothetical protein